MVRRSKGGAIEPPIARTMSPGSRSLIDILLAIVPATPVFLSQACAQERGERAKRALGFLCQGRHPLFGLMTAAEKYPTGMAVIRSRWSSSTRLRAAKLLTAPRRSRSLLLLREGLTQLFLLLLGQVGRDDLEVVLLELVDHLVYRRRPAGQGEQGGGALRHLFSHLLDEVVVDAHVLHRARHPADGRAEEGHEEDQPDQETPERAPARAPALQLAGLGLPVALGPANDSGVFERDQLPLLHALQGDQDPISPERVVELQHR